MLSLNQLAARHASYANLAQIERANFIDPTWNLRELFSRSCERSAAAHA